MDLQQELKSLKALLLSRPPSFTAPGASSPGPSTTYPYSSNLPFGAGAGPGTPNLTSGGGSSSPSPFLSGRSTIPAWQLAASARTPAPDAGTTSKEGDALTASGVLVDSASGDVQKEAESP